MNKRKNIDLVIITGPSGAGRTTALDALEDLGFEAFDNLPLSLLPLLISGAQKNYPLALGIDLRNRDFSNNKLVEVINTINSDADFKCSLLYLDCSDSVLLQRYSETRRRHPLAPNKGAEIGIQKEKSLLASLSLNADTLINTSQMPPHDLKIQIEKLEAEKFYKVHETKPFYNDLCAYLSSGPIVVMILEKENAVLANRELMGATNPTEAEEGTIRKKYGISIDKKSMNKNFTSKNTLLVILVF